GGDPLLSQQPDRLRVATGVEEPDQDGAGLEAFDVLRPGAAYHRDQVGVTEHEAAIRRHLGAGLAVRGVGTPGSGPGAGLDGSRPMTDIGAGAIEQRVLGQLEALQIEHEVLPCDPELADTAAFCAHYGHSPDTAANTIVVAARREPGVACACVALATCRLDVNHTVCDLLGVRKASFASPEQTRELTGMMIGGVTPFGLPGGLPPFIDAGVLDRGTVISGGC